jgi:capsular polysaccharide biosynthesis protein/Mrp family chromosome partitioning ATPase
MAMIPEPNPDTYKLDIHAALSTVTRRAYIIALCVLVACASAVYSHHKAPRRYTSYSDILINEAEKQWTFGLEASQATDPARTMETQASTMDSQPVWDIVNKDLGGDAGDIIGMKAAALDNSDVMRVTVVSTDAGVAQAAANDFASAYTTVRVAQATQLLRSTAANMRSQEDADQSELSNINQKISQLQTSSANDSADTMASLTARRDALNQEIASYDVKSQGIDIDAAIASSGPQVVSKGQPPQLVIHSLKRSLILALALSLATGAGLAFAADYFDARIHTASEAMRALNDTPVLGTIPRSRRVRGRANWLMVAATMRRLIGPRHRLSTSGNRLSAPGTRQAASAHLLATQLDGHWTEAPSHAILVVSPDSSASSGIAADLALAFTRAGHSAILVDGASTHPRQHQQFSTAVTPGLSDVMEGDASLSDALVAVNPSLRILPAGSPIAVETTDTQRLRDVIGVLGEMCDVVLVDGSNTIDGRTPIFAREADVVLLVVAQHETRENHLRHNVELLSGIVSTETFAVLDGFASDPAVRTLPKRRNFGRGLGLSRNRNRNQPEQWIKQ